MASNASVYGSGIRRRRPEPSSVPPNVYFGVVQKSKQIPKSENPLFLTVSLFGIGETGTGTRESLKNAHNLAYKNNLGTTHCLAYKNNLAYTMA